jgi:protein gp37
MAENTSIEWCDHTWSPWEGCTRVSIAKTGGGGCDNCYAERMNRWLHRGENWGPGAPRLEFSDDHWDKLLRWNAAAAKRGAQPKVFPSMCDPFDNEVRAGLRDRFWRAIENTPSLTWLVLTKRVGNAQKMLPQAWLKNGWPSNLWLGATVVNQAEADRDIPKLLAVPARVHFISYEPALGGIRMASAKCAKAAASGPSASRWPSTRRHRLGRAYRGSSLAERAARTRALHTRTGSDLCGTSAQQPVCRSCSSSGVSGCQ